MKLAEQIRKLDRSLTFQVENLRQLESLRDVIADSGATVELAKRIVATLVITLRGRLAELQRSGIHDVAAEAIRRRVVDAEFAIK